MRLKRPTTNPRRPRLAVLSAAAVVGALLWGATAKSGADLRRVELLGVDPAPIASETGPSAPGAADGAGAAALDAAAAYLGPAAAAAMGSASPFLAPAAPFFGPAAPLIGPAASSLFGTPAPSLARTASICGRARRPERAALGDDLFDAAAVDDATPWMVKLDIVEGVFPDGGVIVSNCGGVAIDRQWVLTAAHCVGVSDWLNVRATLGARDAQSPSALRRAVDVALCHPDFDPETLAYDVALLRLSRPLPEDFPLARVADPEEAAGLVEGADALSAGWSRLSRNSVSPYLRRTALQVIDPARPREGMAGGVIVAAPDRLGRSLCVGESGAPLLADLGLGPAVIGVFSSVDAYVDPQTGRLIELCEGFEARSYFTPVGELSGWIADAVAACEGQLIQCLGRLKLSALD